jgi:hypothetical protein
MLKKITIAKILIFKNKKSIVIDFIKQKFKIKNDFSLF